jgi:hypothetical protein
MPTFYQDEAADKRFLIYRVRNFEGLENKANRNKKRSQQDCAHTWPFIAYAHNNLFTKIVADTLLRNYCATNCN